MSRVALDVPPHTLPLRGELGVAEPGAGFGWPSPSHWPQGRPGLSAVFALGPESPFSRELTESC